MITIKAPYGSNFQVIDFGNIVFEYPTKNGGQPSTNNGAQIDEVIFSNSGNGNLTTQIDFIKRYNTWLCFTSIQIFTEKPAELIFISYDRVNKIAYTHTENVVIKQSRP